MNLAQALREKSRLVGEIARKEKRAREAAVVTVSVDPTTGKEIRKEVYTEAEFTTIMQDLSKLRSDLLVIKCQIATANTKSIPGTGGICVQSLIMKRGEAKAELAFWESLGPCRDIYTRDTSVLRMTAGDINRCVDATVDRINKIDSSINELNAEIQI
jgi:hypothetical protein